MKTTPKKKVVRRSRKAPTTIRAALAACVKAFKKQPQAKWAWCIHHGVIVERIDAWGINYRIDYIKHQKPKDEKLARLNNLRPVTETPRFLREVAKQKTVICIEPTRVLLRLYRQQVPFGTWKRGSIFP